MDEILSKAAIHILCERLGFDEGKVYFSLLNKYSIEKEYSYSKYYRILGSLFHSGAVAKIVKEEKGGV